MQQILTRAYIPPTNPAVEVISFVLIVGTAVASMAMVALTIDGWRERSSDKLGLALVLALLVAIAFLPAQNLRLWTYEPLASLAPTRPQPWVWCWFVPTAAAVVGLLRRWPAAPRSAAPRRRSIREMLARLAIDAGIAYAWGGMLGLSCVLFIEPQIIYSRLVSRRPMPKPVPKRGIDEVWNTEF